MAMWLLGYCLSSIKGFSDILVNNFKKQFVSLCVICHIWISLELSCKVAGYAGAAEALRKPCGHLPKGDLTNRGTY